MKTWFSTNKVDQSCTGLVIGHVPADTPIYIKIDGGPEVDFVALDVETDEFGQKNVILRCIRSDEETDWNRGGLTAEQRSKMRLEFA